MSSLENHLNAVQQEMLHLSRELQSQKEKAEQMKQDHAKQLMEMQALFSEHQRNQAEVVKQQKIFDNCKTWFAQFSSSLPQEVQMQMQNEIEKIKQGLSDPQQSMQNSLMSGMAAMGGGMPLPMMLAQAQAQAARGMMPGMAAPSPRLPKTNGTPNGIPGMPPGIANGMAAQMAMAQNPMAQMAAAAASMAGPAQAAQMAQMAQAMAFSGMGAMGGMPQFNAAQMAAMQMQGMGMNGMMLPPMSVANQMAANQLMGHMGLSVSTPSRNPSNGPLSGTRTPQSTNGVNSPRQFKEESAEIKRESNDVISPASEDTVAVA